MNRNSKTNIVRTSDGRIYTSEQCDRRTRNACKAVMIKQKNEYGYNFCKACGVNDRSAIIDPSHDISVKECKENGKAELAWDVDNITPRCRDCHNKLDKLDIKWTN